MGNEALVFVNGKIYTVDAHQPWAGVLAMRQGTIVYVGDDVAAAREAAGVGAEVIDLRGTLGLPGFTDSHIHLINTALTLDQVSLDGVRGVEQALERIAERARQAPAGQWLLGWGWDHNVWGRYPNAAELDHVAPHCPVSLTRKDGHLLWVNSLALHLAQITDETPDPPGGHIQRDANGHTTGILLERARELVLKQIPEPDAGVREATLKRAFPRAHALGLTGVHEMGYLGGAQALADYQRLWQRGELGLRVLSSIPRHSLDAACAVGLATGFGDDWLRIGAVKVFMDGTLGSQTADMLADFEKQPGNRGIIITDEEEMRQITCQAGQAGIAVAVHAIGDAANRKVLNAIEAYQAGGSSRPLLHRIEHAQLLDPDDLPRFGRLGIVASVQPIHATSDMLIAERYWGARSSCAYAFRSLKETGAQLAFGSDSPVETWDVLQGIYAAVTRRRADGTPAGGWHPEQRLTLAEAIHGYTMGAATVARESQSKGSLAVGKVADMVVLDRDLFSLPPEEILQARVRLTVLDGAIVYGGSQAT
ncbi:MAG: amidohydrolase [Chloroflexi bacterium]|nr:amidohydrolase [Chloroflexota bacterium]